MSDDTILEDGVETVEAAEPDDSGQNKKRRRQHMTDEQLSGRVFSEQSVEEISSLLIDTFPDCQPRCKEPQYDIDRYAKAVTDGVILPRIDVFAYERDGERRYVIGDGHLRFAAYGKVFDGEFFVACNVRGGGQEEALRWALQANDTHGVSLTKADKRRAVNIALANKAWAKRSNAVIAAMVGCSAQLVYDVRCELDGAIEAQREKRKERLAENKRAKAASEQARVSRELAGEADNEPGWQESEVVQPLAEGEVPVESKFELAKKAASDLFDEASDKLAEFEESFRSLCDSLETSFSREAILKIAEVRSCVIDVVPNVECPECHGADDNCPVCSGLGWLNRVEVERHREANEGPREKRGRPKKAK